MLSLFNHFDSSDFLEELKKIESSTRRSLNVIRSLRLTPETSVTYTINPEASVAYTIKLGTKTFPVNEIALTSLEERATINGAALAKLRPQQYSRIINSCLRTVDKKDKALVVLYDNEVLAFLSDGYKVLPIDEIFSLVDDELVKKGGKFEVGIADKTFVEAKYVLPEALLKGYEDVVPPNYKPTVLVQSSNIGLSGANIFPELSYKGVQIPVGAPLCLQHKGNATVEKFKENVKQVYSLFNKSMDHLRELKNIPINNPIETLVSVCRKNHIPKKYTATAVEYFRDLIDDDDEVTAYDVYMAITEVIFIAETENRTSKQLLSLKENVARCLNVNWTEFDLPVAI